MQNTVNSNAAEKAKALLNFLSDTAGKAIVTGQHTQTNPMEEIDYIKSKTGKEPLLRGFEMLSYSPNINYNDASEVLIDGAPERASFYHDMDIIAEELKKFREADIPVLRRPFHESDGNWFRWGAKGPETAKELYKLMFEHYTKVHRLNNLLWVWNCRLAEGYPGDEYVDVISVDVYLEKYAKTDYREDYDKLVAAATKNKVAALAEVGYIPDIETLERSHTPWAYYMTWSKEFCVGEQYNSTAQLQKMYASEYALTI